MGLTSLPILNKTGYVNFWQNMWLNKIQNQNLYSLFFSIDIIFDLIVNERYVIFNYYRNNKNIHFSYDSTSFILSTKFSKTYIGEIWVLSYSKWIILSPLFHNFNVISEKYIRVFLPPKLFISKDSLFNDTFF
jgi:hypothetical protein